MMMTKTKLVLEMSVEKRHLTQLIDRDFIESDIKLIYLHLKTQEMFRSL
jgi:hypothetical protein